MWSYIKIVLWEIAFAPVWLLTVLFKGNRTNCLSWALEKWDKDGGYLVVRWCRHNKFQWIRWPHFLWLDEKYGKYLIHAVPASDTDEKHSIPCPWFTAKIKRGDDGETVEN